MGERRELAAIWHALGDLCGVVECIAENQRELVTLVRRNGELLMSQSEQLQTLTEVVSDLRGITAKLATDTNAALTAERNRSRELQTNLDSATTSLSELRTELDKDTLDDAELEKKLAAAEAALAAAQGNAVSPEIVTTLSGLAADLRKIDEGLAQVPAASTEGTPPADTSGTGTAPAPDTSGTPVGTPGDASGVSPDPNAPATAPPGASGATDALGNPIPAETGVPATPFAGGNAGGTAPGLDQPSSPNPEPNPGPTGGGGVP